MLISQTEGYFETMCLPFYKCPKLKFLENKKVHIWPQISQKVIFSVETWSHDQFLGFTYFYFFFKSTSGAVIS